MKCTNNIEKKIIYEYNVSNDNNSTTLINIHIYIKIDKIGPNTHKVVPTPTTTTEKDLEPLVFSSHSLSTNNRIHNRLSAKSYNPLS